MEPLEVAVLGCTGSGKTLLIRRIISIQQQNSQDVFDFSTIPTNGMQHSVLQLKKRGKITFREIGGNFVALWPKYYSRCNTLLFLIDLSNFVQISEACVLFLEMITHKDLQNKKVLLLLTKNDTEEILGPYPFKSIFNLEEVLNFYESRLCCLEISALKNDNINQVMDWIFSQQK